MSAESLREQIAEAIDKHRPMKNLKGCRCGARMLGSGPHSDHLADAVLALLGEVTVEWGVRHPQGVRRETSEAAARDAATEFRKRPGAWAASHLVSRCVGEWEEAE